MNRISPSVGANFSPILTFSLLALLFIPMGCGAVGPPIAPEEVGIEAKIRQQRQDQLRREGRSADDHVISPLDEPVELPEFYPIDIR